MNTTRKEEKIIAATERDAAIAARATEDFATAGQHAPTAKAATCAASARCDVNDWFRT